MQEALAVLEETHAQALDRRLGLCGSAHKREHSKMLTQLPRSVHLSKGLFGLPADIAATRV
jgi:hypothetical protein